MKMKKISRSRKAASVAKYGTQYRTVCSSEILKAVTYRPIRRSLSAKSTSIATMNVARRTIKKRVFFGLTPGVHMNTASAANISAFYESVVEPFALQLSQEFKLKSGKAITFTAERMEFSSAATKIKLLHEAAPLGLMTVNEARHLLALPPVPDGDRRLQSLNYVSAEKADAYQLEESEVKKDEV